MKKSKNLVLPVQQKFFKIDINKCTVDLDSGSEEVRQNIEKYIENIENIDDYVLSYNTKDFLIFHHKNEIKDKLQEIDKEILQKNTKQDWGDFDVELFGVLLMKKLSLENNLKADKYFMSLVDEAWELLSDTPLDQSIEDHKQEEGDNHNYQPQQSIQDCLKDYDETPKQDLVF